MQIKVSQRGGCRNNHELYTRAIEYFAKELIHKDYLKELNVKLVMSKVLVGKYHGYQMGLDYYNQMIYVDKYMPFDRILTCIAHEMVHVKQYLYGELSYTDNDPVWKGEHYDFDHYINTTGAEHAKLIPWEKEAYRLQGKLVKSFIKQLFKV